MGGRFGEQYCLPGVGAAGAPLHIATERQGRGQSRELMSGELQGSGVGGGDRP